GVHHITGCRVADRRTSYDQAVQRQTPLVASASMNRKLHGRCSSHDVVCIRDHAGYEYDERVIAADRRNRLHQIGAEPGHDTCAAGVDDGDVCGDGDRLGDCARPELCVDACGEGAGDLDVLPYPRLKTISHERDAVNAWSKILDAVLAAPIRDD